MSGSDIQTIRQTMLQQNSKRQVSYLTLEQWRFYEKIIVPWFLNKILKYEIRKKITKQIANFC